MAESVSQSWRKFSQSIVLFCLLFGPDSRSGRPAQFSPLCLVSLPSATRDGRRKKTKIKWELFLPHISTCFTILTTYFTDLFGSRKSSEGHICELLHRVGYVSHSEVRHVYANKIMSCHFNYFTICIIMHISFCAEFSEVWKLVLKLTNQSAELGVGTKFQRCIAAYFENGNIIWVSSIIRKGKAILWARNPIGCRLESIVCPCFGKLLSLLSSRSYCLVNWIWATCPFTDKMAKDS